MVQVSFPHLVQKWQQGPISEWKLVAGYLPLVTVVNRNLSLSGKIELVPELNIFPDKIADAESIFPKEISLDSLKNSPLLVLKDSIESLDELANGFFWTNNDHLKEVGEVVSIIRKVSAYRRGGRSLFRDEVDTMESLFGCRAKSNEDFIVKAGEIAVGIASGSVIPKITAAEKILFSKTVSNPADFILITEEYLNRITSSIGPKIRALTGKLNTEKISDGTGTLKANYYMVEFGTGTSCRTYAMRLMSTTEGGAVMRFIAGINNPSKSLGLAGTLDDLSTYFKKNSIPATIYTPEPPAQNYNYGRTATVGPTTIEHLKSLLVPLEATKLDALSLFKLVPEPINAAAAPVFFNINFSNRSLLEYTEADLGTVGMSNSELDEFKNMLVSAGETPNRRLKKGTVKAEKLEVLCTYLAGLYNRIVPSIKLALDQELSSNKIVLTVLKSTDNQLWEAIRSANSTPRKKKANSSALEQELTRGQSARWSCATSYLNMLQNKGADSGLTKSLFTRIGLSLHDMLNNNSIYKDADIKYKCMAVSAILYVYIVNRTTGGSHFKWWESDSELAPIDEQLMSFFEKRGERLIFYIPKLVVPKEFEP